MTHQEGTEPVRQTTGPPHAGEGAGDRRLSGAAPARFRHSDRPAMARVTLPSGDTALAVTRYADVRAVMSDSRFSRDLTYPGAPRMLPGRDISDDPDSLINMDAPRHTKVRRVVARAFTPKRIATWSPRVTEVAESLLEEMVAGTPPVDFLARFALPLPVRVICELLGVPEEDWESFHAWSSAHLSTTAMSAQLRETAYAEFNEYVAAFVGERRRHPGDALVDELIGARDEGARLTENELVRMVLGLIVGGHETTAGFLTKGLLLLLSHPEQYALMVAEPDRVPAAVEEILRYDVQGRFGVLRVATDDVTLPSGTVRRGEAVLPLMASANRDADVFADAARFDITRTDNPHVMFGHGPHFCLGAHLARLEMRVALRGIGRRLPGLRLAVAPDEVEWTRGAAVASPKRLPVIW